MQERMSTGANIYQDFLAHFDEDRVEHILEMHYP
jgi:hypothetical protein